MDYINLGRTGLKGSRICLGCMSYGEPATGELLGGRHAWALNEQDSQPFLSQALDLGINFFDTANVYSSGASEEVLGRFLKAHTRRESVVIATKVQGVMRNEPNGRGLSRKAVFYYWIKACVAWKPITWICTRFIAGTITHRLKRPWRRCTTW